MFSAELSDSERVAIDSRTSNAFAARYFRASYPRGRVGAPRKSLAKASTVFSLLRRRRLLPLVAKGVFACEIGIAVIDFRANCVLGTRPHVGRGVAVAIT